MLHSCNQRPNAIHSLNVQIHEEGEDRDGARYEEEQTALIPFCCSFHTWSFNKAGWHYCSRNEGEIEGDREGGREEALRVMNLDPALMVSMSNISWTHSLCPALLQPLYFSLHVSVCTCVGVCMLLPVQRNLSVFSVSVYKRVCEFLICKWL